jgi:Fe-S-cluster-containing dehydrogenase component
MRRGIAIDSRMCMACYCCYTACKDEHCGYDTALSKRQPIMGQHWMDIREWERGDSSRRVKTATVQTPCSHCQNPPCMGAATVDGAVYKRPDGIVIIDPVKAKGQRQIVDACPIGAIYWNEEYELPQKCTMCAELLDDPDYMSYLPARLKVPRCVEACPNHALIFGDLDDPESEICKVIAANRVTQLEPFEGQETNVVHLNIPTVFLAGTVYYPKAMEEVCVGAKVKLTCRETGETREMVTNYFGDWEFEWLPKKNTFDIEISMNGYKPAIYTAITDIDHYVDMTYLEKA